MGVEESIAIKNAGRAIANAITEIGAAPGQDATGVTVGSLTEAFIGVTAALCKIADAGESIADAIKELSCTIDCLNKKP